MPLGMQAVPSPDPYLEMPMLSTGKQIILIQLSYGHYYARAVPDNNVLGVSDSTSVFLFVLGVLRPSKQQGHV